MNTFTKIDSFELDDPRLYQAPTPQPLGNPAESEESVRTRPDAARGGVAASFSHYVPWWTREDRHGAQKTVCGIWIDPKVSHSTEPTCEPCLAYLLAERAADEVVAEHSDDPSDYIGKDRYTGPKEPDEVVARADRQVGR